jgi:hypothetical protein
MDRFVRGKLEATTSKQRLIATEQIRQKTRELKKDGSKAERSGFKVVYESLCKTVYQTIDYGPGLEQMKKQAEINVADLTNAIK